MIHARRSLPMVLAALLLAACGAANSPQATVRPTSAPQSTSALPPTNAPAPTNASAPTSAPTSAPQATGAPTNAPAPTAAPTSAPEPATAPTSAPQATAAPQPTSAPATGSPAGELLFLRKGALVALDVQTRKERQLADEVRDFVATLDGVRIALVRGQGAKTELWTVQRDGSGLTQLTSNDREEARPSWSPDGQALVFASARGVAPARDWQGWSRWCAVSEVRVASLADKAETTLAKGCDPAISPDGKRIAYAAPPSKPEEGYGDPTPLYSNSIRLMNRQGQNGWDFARATGPEAPAPTTGRVVYAPAWSPDGKQVLYHRFLGYQALVDIDLSEISGSFEGKGKLMHSGAGWLLPAQFTTDGRSVAITENNYSDPRGFGGYDNWSVTVVRMEGSRDILLPTGAQPALGQVAGQLPRGQTAVWSPDGATLAVELPPGWRPDQSQAEPVNADGKPGELWRWQPGSQPSERLAENVDFGSPLAWLPPTS